MDYVENYKRCCLQEPTGFQKYFMQLLTRRAQAIGQKSHKIWMLKYVLDTYMPDQKDLWVMDCGALDGWFLSYESPAIQKKIALDWNAFYGPQLLSEGIQFVQSDMERGKFPLTDASINLLSMLSTIEHLADPIHIASEISRVVKPGGIAFITVPDILKYGFHFWDDITHKRPYNIASLRFLFESHGFETLEACSYNHNLFIAGNLFPRSLQERMMRFKGKAIFYVARRVNA